MVSVVTVLLELERAGVRLDVDSEGRLITDGPAGAIGPGLAERIRRYRVELAWSVLGRRTGHSWSACSVCGEAALVRDDTSPKCRLTPRCEGRHDSHRMSRHPGEGGRGVGAASASPSVTLALTVFPPGENFERSFM